MILIRQLRIPMSVLSLVVPFGNVHAQHSTEKPRHDDGDVEEIMVTGTRSANFTEITDDARKLVEMPGALGDPIAAIYSLPGVVEASGRGNGPAVRGSSPDDNRYYVDFLPTGYVFHQFTNSVFSEFILHDFQLYSAGFGPEYSSVTGAVFDIALREPANQPLQTVVDISMLRSGIFMEGGLTDNSAFFLSARQSLIHLFIPTGEEEDGIVIEEVPKDNDYQAKYAWQINREHSLVVSATGASDKAAAEFTRESEFARGNPDYTGDASLRDGYRSQSVLWDYLGSNSHSARLGVGRFEKSFKAYWGDDFYFNYDLTQNSVRGQYSAPWLRRHELTVGGHIQQMRYDINYDQVQFICTEFEADCNLNRRDRIQDRIPFDFDEHVLYLNNAWSISNQWSLDTGLQWQHNDYTRESFFNPRVALAYAIHRDWTLTAKAGRYNRFPDIAQIAPGLGNPALKSPAADHYTLGVEQQLDDDWSWSAEIYYKNLQNLPLGLQADDDDAALLYSNDVNGRAFGIDLFINKNFTDKWYGWLATSYAQSERTNERTSETRDYQFDTPLVVNWVMSYQRSERFNVGWRWTIRSGAPYTPIESVTENPFFENAVYPVYGDPFSERLPTYSRLDVRLKWDFTLFGRYESSAILDIINALNQRNVSRRSLDYGRVRTPSDPVTTEDTKSPGVIPAATLRIIF